MASNTVIERFGSTLRGELIVPGDPGHDEARRVWNGMIDRHPALIARCANESDVVAAVRFAGENDLGPAVRGGGHNVAGFGTCDDGMVIDLSPMKAIRVDAAARTARAQPGLTRGEFDSATQAHGLATTGGLVSTTGIAERSGCGVRSPGTDVRAREHGVSDGDAVHAGAFQRPRRAGGAGRFSGADRFRSDASDRHDVRSGWRAVRVRVRLRRSAGIGHDREDHVLRQTASRSPRLRGHFRAAATRSASPRADRRPPRGAPAPSRRRRS